MLRSLMIMIALTAVIFANPGDAQAGDVEIVEATAGKSSNGTWSFDVTLKHADTGWDHYANKWDVVSLDGKLLGERVLHHPHVNEQPFTRSLSGVKIPIGTSQVTIRAYDKVHGQAEATKTIILAD